MILKTTLEILLFFKKKKLPWNDFFFAKQGKQYVPIESKYISIGVLYLRGAFGV